MEESTFQREGFPRVKILGKESSRCVEQQEGQIRVAAVLEQGGESSTHMEVLQD